MEIPQNLFKQRLLEGTTQYGLWVSLADSVAAEIVAGAGFDWFVIDAEHAPNDVRSILHQLQAVSGYTASPIVRPIEGTKPAIKQLLDIGAQTILVPMVETAEQAKRLVRAMRYPPDGERGVATARSARWGRVENYWRQADAETCLIVQVESNLGLENLTEITAVDGVDAVFIGPSDLGASLGHLGDAKNPKVRRAVCDALSEIRAGNKSAGVLTTNPSLAVEFTEAGANFVGVGVDTILLANATSALVAEFQRSR